MTSLGDRLHELSVFASALLANTLDYIDPMPAAQRYMGSSIRLVTQGVAPIIGIAATCQLDTSTPTGEHDFGVWTEQLERIARTDEPVVWVVQVVGTRPDHECVLGDGMATALASVGCRSVVTNGGVRDLEGLARVGFTAHATGTTVHHCALRYRSVNEPVEVGGITVHPGDVIHGDAEGVIKIPHQSIDVLPEMAAKMQSLEALANSAFGRADLPIAERFRRVDELFSSSGFSMSRER